MAVDFSTVLSVRVRVTMTVAVSVKLTVAVVVRVLAMVLVVRRVVVNQVVVVWVSVQVVVYRSGMTLVVVVTFSGQHRLSCTLSAITASIGRTSTRYNMMVSLVTH